MKTCPRCGNEYPDSTTLCPSDGAALETTQDSLIGKTLAGKYRIGEALSEGGMGKVYRGTHILMDKTVAIKVLRPSLAADEKIVARFSREARAASRISHPHALSVNDFGEDEGRVFLVMEYLHGKTLKGLIREEGPMTLKRVVDIIRQVGGALDAAHAQGVIHRDLKSDNIMLLNTGGTDYAKVLDFGIAKINEPEGGYDSELTAPNLVVGTPQYMSPEQCSQSTEIDARSDIYSLGIILYEMLVGHVPFTGESSTAVMLKQIQEPAPSVLKERADLPAAVGRVVERALEKRPNERYQHAGELVEELTVASNLGMPSSVAEQTSSGSYRPAEQEDVDEETLVRPRVEQVRQAAPVTVPIPQPTIRTFNPWKILIPSAAGLLVIFSVIYAFTRNSQQTNTPVQPSLTADPNSRPVEPAPPATGKSEQGITPAASQNTPVNTNANANVSPSVNPELPPSQLPINENSNASENTNTNRKAPPLPSPSRPANVNEPPAPLPSPTESKPAAPKPSPTQPPPAIGVTPGN